jgi:excisionase family DNA binding protein
MEALSPTRPVAYTISEAANQLRCSRSHIYNLVSRGAIKVVKIGHRSLIAASEIERLLVHGTDSEAE